MILRCKRCGKTLTDGIALSCSHCGAITCPSCAESGVCGACYGDVRYLQ